MELSHYTNAAGLLSILKSSSLWSSDIRFLNDFKELEVGITELHKFIDNEISQPSLTEIDIQTNKFYESLKGPIEKNLKNRGIYITSFTSKEDNLRQWMSYCPSNSGYCIVFDKNQLLISGDEEAKRNIVARLEEVHYQSGEFIKLISRDYIIEQIRKNRSQESLITEIVNNLMFHCCAIKPNEFIDESESRLVVQGKTTREHVVEFREKSGVIIPYFVYPIDLKWINKIIIGPNVNMDLAKKGLKDLIADIDDLSCTVEESNCSLRQI